MPHHLIRKLDHHAGLADDDAQTLRRLVRDAARVGPGHDLIEEGSVIRQICVIMEGWACAYKQFEDGRRQIIACLIPGDLCSAPLVFPTTVNYSVATLTSARVAQIPGQALLSALARSPCLARAIALDILAASAIQREWTANVGLRTARERIAHLFCEIVIRMRAADLNDGDRIAMPLTQAELGQMVGLSTVHVNRTLQDLRASGLITLKRQQLSVQDFAALQRVARFDGTYLRHASRDDEADARPAAGRGDGAGPDAPWSRATPPVTSARK